MTSTAAAAPTATATLVQTTGPVQRQVSVVRVAEVGDAPAWLVHLNGEAPIYCALTRREALNVALWWASQPVCPCADCESGARRQH